MRLCDFNRAIHPRVTPFSAVAHQIKALQLSTRESNQAFWAEQMRKHPQPVGELALSEPSVPDSAAAIEEVSFTIPLTKIVKASREAGVSLMAWYQAAWAMTLSMYTDSASIVFGTVLAGRNLPIKGAHDTIGPLVSILLFGIINGFLTNASTQIGQYVALPHHN
jgi:gliotoxin/aspirochlorine biosynthesis peptide synthetase